MMVITCNPSMCFLIASFASLFWNVPSFLLFPGVPKYTMISFVTVFGEISSVDGAGAFEGVGGVLESGFEVVFVDGDIKFKTPERLEIAFGLKERIDWTTNAEPKWQANAASRGMAQRIVSFILPVFTR
jgi:hypothetical protein